MSELIDTLRAIVRDEIGRSRAPGLGIVTRVYANEDGAGDGNHQVDVRLRESGVALERVPVTTARRGVSMLPRVDELVVVVFIGGELRGAVVVGALYDAADHPPQATAVEAVYAPVDDGDASTRRLAIVTPSGEEVTITDDEVSVVGGGTEVRVYRDGNVEIRAAGALELAAQGDVTIRAGGRLTLEAQQELSARGLSATVEAQTEARIQGVQLGLVGQTSFSPS